MRSRPRIGRAGNGTPGNEVAYGLRSACAGQGQAPARQAGCKAGLGAGRSSPDTEQDCAALA